MPITAAPVAKESSLSPLATFVDPEPDAIHACRILIIDDEEPNVRLLERVVASAGFENFISTTDSREAAALFTDFQPDLVLTDWLMPHVDGCAVIERLRALTATDDYLPIVVLTADITREARKRALTAGATDFLTKPFDQLEVLLRIQNLLKARVSHLIVQAQNATLEASVRLRTIELERALNDLRATQQQVIRQERLAALGTMAGGIAHDFNNALSVIKGFSDLLLRDAEHGLTKEQATPPITLILTAAEDAAKVVHRLREFYRPDESEEEYIPVDLNQLVEQAVSLTQPRWQTEASAAGRPIELTTDLGVIPVILGDAAELREVLTNVIFNAVDALPEGGSITLSTRLDGKAVLLAICDTGIGMNEEVRERCLEPFFTTKGKRGTGLGLSMVFGIMHRHAGSIEIASAPGRGTTFMLRLPATIETTDAQAELQPSPNRSLRVLVVDDQPIPMQPVCGHLEHDLHTVETALGATEALEKFRRADFDVVITDLVMAGMNGEQLAVAMKKEKPEVPVILLTGYPGVPSAVQRYSEAIDVVLAKPLSRAALRNAFAKAVVAS